MTSISRIYKRHEDLLKKLKEKLDPSIFVNPPAWMQELMMQKPDDDQNSTTDKGNED